MGAFKEMEPELAWRLIEGYTDELTPESKSLDAYYRQFRCPRCKSDLVKEFDARTAFSHDDAIGHALLRCPNCKFLIEPHTHVVIESGSPAKIPVEVIPILGETKD